MASGVLIQGGLQQAQQVEGGVSGARDGSIRPAVAHSLHEAMTFSRGLKTRAEWHPQRELLGICLGSTGRTGSSSLLHPCSTIQE